MKEYFPSQAKQQWSSSYAVHLHNCYFSRHLPELQKTNLPLHRVQMASQTAQGFGQCVTMSPGCSVLLEQ